MKTFYITTPIYYVNDKPHIGHAYTSLAADISARFKRLDGYEVLFLTGTDEHGQKVETSAKKAGVCAQDYADSVSDNFLKLTELMNFSNDDFIRTTEARHKKTCLAFWKKLLDGGHIYLGEYSGWYAVRDEAYYNDDEIVEVDGEKRAPSGAPVEWVCEPSYFFNLSKWGDKLLKFYTDNPNFVCPKSKLNEVTKFVEGGLSDLSISRTAFSWGIPVENDEKHVMYVWLDALTNYLTALDYSVDNKGYFKKFWPANVQIVGKDILRFHAVYWPAFLMACGLELPDKIFAHGWWTNDGQKISKSTGNVIDPIDLIDKFGLDQTRYFLMREVPFGRDGDFSESAIVKRINSDLANDLGNFCQRSLAMIYKGDAVIPKFNKTDADVKLIEQAQKCFGKVSNFIDNQAYSKALEVIWEVIKDANKYIDAEAPWKYKTTDPKRMDTILYCCCEIIRVVGILLQPFMPDSANRILNLIALSADKRSFSHLKTPLISGVAIIEPKGVFPRYQL